MSIKDNYNNKRVTFDTQDRLEEKRDRLTVMMSKLAANDEGTNKQFKAKIFHSKRRGQTRNFYDKHNYDPRNYQNRYRSHSGDRRIQYGKNYRGRPRYEQSYRNDFRRGNFKSNARMYQNQNFRRQNNRGGYRGNYRNEIMKEAGVGLEKGNIKLAQEGMTEAAAVGQGQDQG